MTQPILDENYIGPRYQLHELLGAGGMGVVYRATDRLTQQSVALKRLAVPPELLDFMSRADREDLRLSLAREFQFLASLRHPNIVSVLDYGFDMQGQPYLALELLQNARTITDAGTNSSVFERVQLLIQILQALVYLHRRGIVHRDLKPSNILVVEDHVKLLDFGLSETRGQHGAIRGTPAYLAPEILEGDPASEASDLYTVGVVAYELFAGHTLFVANEWEALVNTILTGRPDMSALAIPDSLAKVIEKLLAKRASNRYSSAREALSALANAAEVPVNETTAIQASFLQAARFIGRESELDMLLTAIKGSRSNRGSLWLVRGESGVGKSRLLDELRINALVDGFLVLPGRADENGLPYHVWHEPLRKLILGMDISSTDAGTLKLLLPDIDQLLGHPVTSIRHLDPVETERHLSSAIISLFRLQTQPVLLLLEDLHLAGEESLTLLSKLEQIIHDIPLTIVGSYRDDESAGLSKQLQTRHILKLNRLAPQEIAKLSEAMLGEAGGHQAVQDLLANETEGNAFFLVEVVRALAEQAGRLDRIGSVTLPAQVFTGGIQRVVQRRIDQIPPVAYPLLKIAATYGRQLDLAVLHTVQPMMKIDEWLLICSDAAVLRVQDDHWFFSHDKIREGILAEIKSEDLALLHGEVASAIEQTYSSTREFSNALAYHWERAGSGPKEFQYSMLAGDRAYQLSAYQEALRYFERAQTLIESEQIPATPLQRGNLGTFLGRIQMMLSNYSVAQQILSESLIWATQANEPNAQADVLWSLGYVAIYEGNRDAAVQHFEHSLKLYQQSGNLYGMADALRGLARIESTQGLYGTAQLHLETSLAFARESTSDWHISRALADLGSVESMQGAYEAAARHLEESLALYRASGDRVGSAHVLLNIGQLAVFRRGFDLAARSFQESIAIAREIGEQRAAADALNNLGYVEMAQQNFTAAKNNFEECLTIFKTVGFQWGIANSLVNLGHVEFAIGNLDRATQHYLTALQHAQPLGATPILLEIIAGIAKIRAQRKQPSEAVTLASFALGHIATNPDIRAIAEPLLDELRATMPVEKYEQARRAGQNLSLDEILADHSQSPTWQIGE